MTLQQHHFLSITLWPLLLTLAGFLACDFALADDADTWRKIRQGTPGYSAVKGRESNVLIQSSGQDWRLLRNGPVTNYGAWSLVVTVIVLGFFFLIRGRIKLTGARTGEIIPRWNPYERLLHWFTAIIFLILMLSGLSLLFGRPLLIPIIGHAAFSHYAELALLAHNTTGPLFVAGLMLMLLIWAKDNIPNTLDIQWLKAYGGMIGHKHPSAERINAGEKCWFWLLVVAGTVASITGLVLVFPALDLERNLMQLSHLLHACSAFLLCIGAFGHIYIGSIGTEGALEAMTTGNVDSSWAKQHHDHWYQQIKQQTTENGSDD